MTTQIIISVCLVCLFLHFIIWAVIDPRSYKKRWEESINKERLPRYIKTVIFVLIYLGVSLYAVWPSTQKDDAWASFGLILFILGESIAIWGRLTMNKNWGIPGVHDIKRQSALVTSGSFSYTRNPIYLGLLCMFIGFSLALKSYSIFLCPIVFYEIYQTVLIEEKLLEQKFGEQYKHYASKVPRFL